MFGFPVNLQDSGVQKFTNDADNGFPKIQQREVFYSVKDGAWDDPSIWQTASGRIGKIPGQFDDVYAKHQVALNPNFTINNLFVSGRVYPIAGNRTYNINGNFVINHNASYDNNLNNGITINVFGDIKCFGSFTMNNNSHILRLYGQNNYIEKSKFTSSVSSAVNYERVGNQDVLDLNYGVLNVYRPGTKTLQGNTIVQGSLTCQGDSDDLIFELGGYDFSVLGGTFIFRGSIKRSTSSPILFVGNVAINGNSINSRPFILDGNCNVEFRGGISIGSNQAVYILGSSGTFSFTTNNQSISGNANDLFIDNPIVIGTGVTLTMASSVRVYLNNTINGADSTSTLLMGLNGQMYFNTSVSVPSMTTGIWNFTTNANTIGYTGNYTATIPSYFTTFHNLTISGTGTKSLGVNTTLNGVLTIGNNINTIFEIGTYNFSQLGTTTSNQINGALSKSGSGNLIFSAQLVLPRYGGGDIRFSGNPNVEFRNGFSSNLNYGESGNNYIFNTGTGQWRFTTNNQFFSPIISNVVWNNTFSIANNIVVTQNGTFTMKTSLNGEGVNSKLINNGTIINTTLTDIMTTGILDLTSLSNTIGFHSNGNMNINYGNFWSLSIGGTGTKSATQNISLIGNLNIEGDFSIVSGFYVPNNKLELSTFNLSVNGTTGSNSINNTLSKTGSGSILFASYVISQRYYPGNFQLNGNPTIEFRNGFLMINMDQELVQNFGTGQLSFTTNNQTIDLQNKSGVTFNNSILIDSNITLSVNAGVNKFISNSTINGANANSKILMNANSFIQYNAATQPMATGILDTSTNANTWIYGSGNQDIKGGPTTGAKQVYRNLTLNGGGTKTLQGFVSVLNTYTLTAPATLNNNGFTLTNP